MIWLWAGFLVLILALLALDLGVVHRKAHVVSIREAAAWSTFWISLALTFNFGIYHFMGAEAGLEFLTGYLIEKALSVDNIFVFVLLFSYFRVPAKYQHRVLFWGIIGALALRGVMIGAGTVLIERFHWITWFFGALLLFTGVRMAISRGITIHPDDNPAVKLVRRVLAVTPDYHGQKFFVRQSGMRFGVAATPLFVVLVLVETTDIVFAVDSIPAVFAVTRDPFLVFTSNVFAILGLRALYFLLAGVMDRFRFLKLGLSIVLVFVGTKMLIADFYKVPIGWSLAVIATVLTASVALSLLLPARIDPDEFAHLETGGEHSDDDDAPLTARSSTAEHPPGPA
ncbi:MAG: TerC family protein [Gemmatimonadota bacterium]